MIKTLLATVLSVFAVNLLQAADKPNVILIMADDLGYECIGANGCEDYKTPVLDKMASEGVRFSNCFANPLCTPSRVKLMTGMYNVRNYTKFGRLDRSQKTFAHAFKKAGYATCIAGKWQLGKEKDSPQHFGFDEACLWQQSEEKTRKGTKHDSRYPNPVLEFNGKVKVYENGEYGPDECTTFITQFIEKNKSQPFMVYYPMLLTHCPFDATPDSEEWNPKSLGSTTYKGDAKYFGDMVSHMDKGVGRILGKLEELKLRDNTLVIFTGDNGTDQPIKTKMSGRVISGGKGQMNDNGTRVPLIVSWPGTVKPGWVSDDLVDFTDMLPTLCEAVGIQVPAGGPMDGVSFIPCLKGETTRKKPWVYVWYKGQVFARTKTEILSANQDLTGMTFSVSKRAYEQTDIDPAKMTEEQKTSRQMLEKVLQDMKALTGDCCSMRRAVL